MGGSKQTQTQSQTRDPWGPSQGLLTDVLSQARAQGGDTSLFTPTFSGSTMAGVQGLESLGSTPGSQQTTLPGLISGTQAGYGVGNDALMATASGGMLNGNPFLDSVLGTAGQKTADAVNAQFSGAGRYGSGAHAGVLADRIGALQTQARMDDYNNERTRQLGAAGQLQTAGIQGAGLSGQLDQANLTQAGTMLQAGGIRDQMDAATRQAPLTATQWMAGIGTPIAGLGGTSNGTTTTTTPANVPGMIMSGLTAGAGLMSGNPMMALQGLGGLGGQVMNSPGTAANGGWSTTANKAPSGLFSMFGGA